MTIHDRAEAASRSAFSFPVSPEWPRTHFVVIGAFRSWTQLRRWSQRNASGELYSSRDAIGAMTRCIMWIADLESVLISSGADGGVMAIAVAIAIASILVELSGCSR